MNLANKYFMRPSGESKFQANGYGESIAMGVTDSLKQIEDFSVAIEELVKEDKVNLSSLNNFMESLVHAVDKDKRLYDDLSSIFNVIENNDILKPVCANMSSKDMKKLCHNLVSKIEILRPLKASVGTEETGVISWLFKAIFKKG